MNKRVTIEDVANELKISRSLVSKALNDKYGVNDETRSKIRYTAAKMGYDFSNIKHNEKAKTSEFGLLIGDIKKIFAETFYLSILSEIERVCEEKHIMLSVNVVHELCSDSLKNISREKLNKKGLLCIGGIPKEDLIILISFGIPLIVLEYYYDDLKVNRIRVDDDTGTCEATRYLIECGHSKIGFVGETENFKRRYNGYMNAMIQAKIAEFEKYCCVAVPSENDDALLNSDVFLEIMSSEDCPTAVICGNDAVAAKIYSLADDLGLIIPDDLSVIGFDDQKMCEWLDPPLTSVRFDVKQLARHSVEMLENAIKYPENVTSVLTLDTQIIKRGSVKILG